MSHWQRECENRLDEIKQLQETIHKCNEETLAMRSEQLKLQTQCEIQKNKNIVLMNAMEQFKKQSELVHSALNGGNNNSNSNISSNSPFSTDLSTAIATAIVHVEQSGKDKKENENENENDELKDWNQSMEKHNLDIQRLQLLPKQMALLQRELKLNQGQLAEEREKTNLQIIEWKSRVDQQNAVVERLH
ncbi:hypothetical protein RFI_35192 [Reticulomyxa filosa]|uniref:Uncharacterized protein n=1 Tax=Reticulomyxa filosa TaxID=46433 RepID=X6LKU4_RETFI|nr:hypothetical protein RFI_35192 [Reticulomyxa filosa]|eukprot:ETO02244.1 hypothetical protein RFI_35192 [Reticulomyxa filosa]